jgi:hypothetical protein
MIELGVAGVLLVADLFARHQPIGPVAPGI